MISATRRTSGNRLVKHRCRVCRPQYGSPWKAPVTEHKERDPLAATLYEMLLAPDVKPQVVADCQALVERELDSKSGISGTAIKIAYKAITAFKHGAYTET